MAEINIMVGGEAGQGLQTVGFILAKTLSRSGLHVFSDQDYESRIRGGHSFCRVRASDRKVQAISESVDILVALDQNTIDLHRSEVKPGGLAIFDQDRLRLEGDGIATLRISLERLAQEKSGNKILANSVAAGAALAAAGYAFDPLAQVLRDHFSRADLAEANVTAARAGFDHAVGYRSTDAFPHAATGATRMMLVDGNQALAIGAMAAGCKFVSAYPMTPSSSIMETMAAKGSPYNIVVMQPEDEIAAINMVVGAAYAGVRAMTATSGSGFDLMTEGISLAGVTETPVVVVLGQRPGPAVGLPTRTDQTELEYAIYTAHGEFPRAVLTPIDIEDCFHAAVKAFNLAERYQTPVIILSDQHLATSTETVPEFDLASVKIDRGDLASAEAANSPDYKRHRYTESGISPRAFPMQGTALVCTDSDEHDETGHLTENAVIRRDMVSKRLRKMTGLTADAVPPRVEPAPGAKVLLLGWGSSYGAIREAAELLGAAGIPASVLQLRQAWPFPKEAVTAYLTPGVPAFTVEGNATGQLAHLIRSETGIRVNGSVLKYDGRPLSPQQIAAQLKKEVL